MISSRFLDRFLLAGLHFLFLRWKVSTVGTGNRTPEALGIAYKSAFPGMAIDRGISSNRKWSISSVFPVWFPVGGL
jgi:hypothetical protein